MLTLIEYSASREEIITYVQGAKRRYKTTGNGNANEIFYPNLHLPFSLSEPLKTKRKIREQLQTYYNIRDIWLLDVANEDPRAFLPTSTSYWEAAAKRGYLFNLIGLSFIVMAFWVFVLRIAFGECGGYKMIIRRSEKKDRYFLHAISLTGFLVFTSAYCYTVYYMLSERMISRDIGKSLIRRNKHQLESSEKLKRYLKNTNVRKMTVTYSEVPFDKFKIGDHMRGLINEYTESLEEAYKFRESFFETASNAISSRALILLFITGCSLTAFMVAYKKRIRMVSMIVSMILLFVVLFCFDNISSLFNFWSVYIDMCKVTVPIFDHKDMSLRYMPTHPFQNILTCLGSENKQNLVTQINSVLIAQNSIFIMLRNYFEIQDRGLIMEGLLDSALSVERNIGKIVERLKNTSEGNRRSFSDYKKYIMLITELNKTHDELERLSSCHELNVWITEFNDNVCGVNLSNYYNMMWGYAFIILGVFTMVCTMYISESIVQSLHKEESFYVKTRKLRFDWN